MTPLHIRKQGRTGPTSCIVFQNPANFRWTFFPAKDEESSMRYLRYLLILSGLAAMIFAQSPIAQAADQALALKGYDPVAYFTESRPMVGNPQYQHEWDGATYRFASAKHLELFKADPDRYLPQYKNWCAASVARGEKVYGNPEWWLVVDGGLYLFGKPMGAAAMAANAGNVKRQADENWSKVSRLPAPPAPDYMLSTTRSN
jgi:YHS domain-containing protein